MKKPFYITTTLPYVNAEPHIGFAMELVRADIIARYETLAGREVFFNTGTDEHGLKIYQKAKEQGLEPQAYCDQASAKFKGILPALGIMPSANFIRTTDPHHVAAAQEFWRAVDRNGYIYKKDYSIKYCVGCELEKTDSELVDGRCPLHPLQQIELIQEENYFFKFSAFGQKLLALYSAHPDLVIPDSRFHEIKTFVERGLEDFSISRLATKMPWGVPVPGDDAQVMYVWFDALVNYISAVGWPSAPEDFERWWIDSGGVVQYCGKDNLRQQSAMWQAMLMAAGLPPSRSVVIDGFITGDGGLKMSKSLGNTVDPMEIVNEYGTDALRYYVAREIHPFEDSPFTMDKFKEAYNAHLANGIGNLTNRIIKVTSGASIKATLAAKGDIWKASSGIVKSLEAFNIQAATNEIWHQITAADKKIQETEPFKLLKAESQNDVKKGIEIMIGLLQELWRIAILLEPIMPATSAKIQECIQVNKMPEAPLFMRK